MEYYLVIEDVITATCSNMGKSHKYTVEPKKPNTRVHAIWLCEIQKQAKLKMVFRNAYLVVKL